MSRQEIPLLLEDAFKQFDQSHNRVRSFLCIANSLSIDALPKEWVIYDENKIGIGIHEPPDKKYLIDAYQHFLRTYLVRDCIESFMLSLDQFLLRLLCNGKRIVRGQSLLDTLSANELKTLKNFEWQGLTDKVEELKKDFGFRLSDEYEEITESLNKLRNCFTHSNGFVRPCDGIAVDASTRRFTWKSTRLVVESNVSDKRSVLKKGQSIEEESRLLMERFVDHSQDFKIGEQLSLSSLEVCEIALTLHEIAHEYLRLFEWKINQNLGPTS